MHFIFKDAQSKKTSDSLLGDPDFQIGTLYLPHNLRREKKCRIVLENLRFVVLISILESTFKMATGRTDQGPRGGQSVLPSKVKRYCWEVTGMKIQMVVCA